MRDFDIRKRGSRQTVMPTEAGVNSYPVRGIHVKAREAEVLLPGEIRGQGYGVGDGNDLAARRKRLRETEQVVIAAKRIAAGIFLNVVLEGQPIFVAHHIIDIGDPLIHAGYVCSVPVRGRRARGSPLWLGVRAGVALGIRNCPFGSLA